MAATARRVVPRIVFPVSNELMRDHLKDAWRQRLSDAGMTLDVRHSVPTTRQEWCDVLRGATGAVLAFQLPSGVLTACNSLELISFAGTGVSDRVDLAEATARGVTVTNVTGYGDNAVAEHAIGLLLSLARRITRHDRSIRQGTWDPGGPGWELRKRRLGVVGLGGNGSRMTVLARALGMEVVTWTRRSSAERAAMHQAEAVSLEELFETSDAVTLHIALTPSTEQFVGHDLLGRMRPGALLVNTSRGRIIDQDALVRALIDGPLGGAALDVFEDEPLPVDHPLVGLTDRTVLTPHIAYNTAAATIALVNSALDNVVSYLEGSPRNVIAGPSAPLPT